MSSQAEILIGRTFAKRWRERMHPDPNQPRSAPRPFPYFDHRNCSQWSGE